MNGFRCVCCRETFIGETPILERSYGGMVCEECHQLGLLAMRWLSPWGIDRPFTPQDLNPSNLSRVEKFYP